jgi:hypothetical protein
VHVVNIINIIVIINIIICSHAIASSSPSHNACRQQAAAMLHALCGSGWFVGLPGPARACIVDAAMQDLSRRLVWAVVEAHEWEAASLVCAVS